MYGNLCSEINFDAAKSDLMSRFVSKGIVIEDFTFAREALRRCNGLSSGA